MFSIHHFKSIDSTNEIAKKYPYNSVVIADSQKKGKGRHKRRWISSKGGIYLSIVIKPQSDLIQHYTFIASLAACKACQNFSSSVRIKWPNDLIIQRKKICGILTVNVFHKNTKKTIIGIGINTNNIIPKLLSKRATTLSKETSKKIDNADLICSVLSYFEKYLKDYHKSGFNHIKKEWLKNADFLNQEIIIKSNNKTISGIAKDVDNKCQILLKMNSYNLVPIREGDLFYKSNKPIDYKLSKDLYTIRNP